ncbi:FtsJ-like methyltransferase family protein [Metarhizium guizhouense ARSEF 977]|uniref:FtsJ-like methyltransferase family protein n=1 Tax=Metarhizium guizhouense (strain ARSEF 977) TaxID=1276136 RepID=A0A0B4H3J4_METGA|nr:FtsJ-like methyltransferase family protein [Metarhizium guizhouense ARSEF 977]
MTTSSSSTLKMEHPAQAMYADYFLKNSPQYVKLHKIRQQGSNNPNVDEYYNLKCAWSEHELWEMPNDNSCKEGQDPYLKMRCKMSEELDQDQKILSILEETPQPSVLETGMAVGGFSQHVLERYPHAKITGISIPDKEGGYPVGFESDNVHSVLKNVGTLAGDVGVSDIPETHQTATSLTMERVLPAGEEYDLIFCQERPVREPRTEKTRKKSKKRHKKHKKLPGERQIWSNSPKYIRILMAQLVIAMKHLRENGTIVVLMRKADDVHTFLLLDSIWKFSEVSLYKHRLWYQTTSSFYLVAKKTEVEEYIGRRWGAADGSEESVDEEVQIVSELLEDRGKLLIELAAPVWEAQADGLESLFKSLAKGSKQSPPSECLHANKLARKLNPNWNPFSVLNVDY